MGIDLLSWALGKNGRAWPKGPDRLMFIVLAEMAHDDDAFCWPGVELLRSRCNLEDRTSVERTINRLIQGGWIANDERYVARPGRPVDGQKRGYRLLVPPDDWAPLAAKRAPKPRANKESRSEAALPVSGQNAAPTQGNAAPEPKKCRSDAFALRKEPLRTLTEPLYPPSPLTGGDVSTDCVTAAERNARAGLQVLSERLWSEHQRRMSRKLGKAIKARLRVGESIASVWADCFAPDDTPSWDPPVSNVPATKAILAKLVAHIRLQAAISEHSWCTWIAPLWPVAFDRTRGRLTIAFPSEHGQHWLIKNYGELVTASARECEVSIEFWQPNNPSHQETHTHAHA